MELRAVLTLTALLSVPLSAGQMVVFGDSLSDTGYWGPFTNPDGTLWHEYLANRLSYQRATTSGGFLTPGTSGLNLAVGGAKVTIRPFLIGNLQDQVNRFDARNYTWQDGDLCTLWIGGNDLRDKPTQDMAALTADIGNIITQLISRGIDHFLVPNLPDLGAVPESLGDTTKTAATMLFNQELEATLDPLDDDPNVTIDRLDIFTLFNEMRGNAGDYGFTNTTTRWDQNQGDNPDGYVFYDNIHPTTRSHSMVAAAAHVVLDPDGAGIEVVSWSISPAGTLRKTWFADPGALYQVLSGPSPDQLTPAAGFTGKPAYTATVPSPGTPAGFFQIRRN